MTELPPAVILAAGESSRFWPLSTHGHKALHRLAGQSIIEHTVRSLAAAGVHHIIIVQSPIAQAAHFPKRTIEGQLGDGSAYGVTIQYVEQPEAEGPGPAIRLAIDHLEGDFFVVQPESINGGAIVQELWQARQSNESVVAGQAQEETWLYGVFGIKNGLMIDVVEKPEPGQEPSKICRMAVELLTKEYAEELRQQPPHEFSNIFALQALAKRQAVRIVEATHLFYPLKYPWHLFAMAEELVPEGPWLGPNVVVADGATLSPDCVIERDAYIGKGVHVEKCLIGAGSHIDSSLSNAIVGAGCTIAPDVIALDRATDHGHVTVDVKGHQISTAMQRLGPVVGQSTTIEGGARLDPGVLIGAEATIAAGAAITANVSDRSGVNHV